jgi:hypothetical protein
MATPPVFSAGAVLTAAQMNAVGLWLVKTDTIATAATTKTVSSAFNADFEAYRILIKCAGNASAGLRFALGNTSSNTNGWYGTVPYFGANALDGAVRFVNQPAAEIGFTDSYGASCFTSFDVFNPYNAANTYLAGSFIARNNFTSFMSFVLTNTTSYTSFTLSDSSGANLTSGTIYVYGYRD